MNDQDLLTCVRALLGGARAVKEIKMFGGIAFMLNGNLLVAASIRGLLARVGKDAEREALMRPGATPMIMRGRLMNGYIRVDASSLPQKRPAPNTKRARVLRTQTMVKKTHR